MGTLLRKRKEDGNKHLIWCSTYLYIHWFFLVCALTRDRTFNLGITGWCSNQSSYRARTKSTAFWFKPTHGNLGKGEAGWIDVARTWTWKPAPRSITTLKRSVLQNIYHSLHFHQLAKKKKSHKNWKRTVQCWHWVVRAIHLNSKRLFSLLQRKDPGHRGEKKELLLPQRARQAETWAVC